MNAFDDLDIASESWAFKELQGQDRWETTWTPTRTGWTDVGAITVLARFRVVGRSCEFQIKVTPATSIATTAGTSYFNLPVAATGYAGIVTMFNLTSNIAVGTGGIDAVNSRAYVPSQAANAGPFAFYGRFEI